MKWTSVQVQELKALCFDGVSNATIAAHFGVSVTDIHAKRSQLGITIPKVAEAKAIAAAIPARGGLETFVNAGDTCIVLARSGDSALIVIPSKSICQFVVPLEHKPGARHWWQGHYFNTLDTAWEYYQSLIQEEERNCQACQ